MRVTAGPRGTYVSISRGAFRYRKRLAPAPKSAAPAPAAPSPHAQRDGFITTAGVESLAASSADGSLQDIQKRVHGFDYFLLYLFFVGGSALALAILLGLQWPPLAALTLVPFAVGAFPVYAWNRERRTARLIYDLECPELVERYALAHAAGAALGSTQVLWHVYYSVATRDQKRNAGAGRSVQRLPVRCTPGSLPLIECNIEPYSVPIGPQQLLFLPDRLIVHERGRFASLPYAELHVENDNTEFIERGRLPSDSPHVRNTWQYVNKSGGPDRRFNDNRQIPVMLYGALSLRSRGGMNIELSTSSPEAAHRAADALRRLAQPISVASAQTPNHEDEQRRATAVSPPFTQQSTQPPSTEDLAHAVATLLRYIAAADRRIDDRELAIIGSALREVTGDDQALQSRLLGSIRKIRSGDKEAERAIAVVRCAGAGAAARVIALAQDVANADGKVTPKETERLDQLRAALSQGT